MKQKTKMPKQQAVAMEQAVTSELSQDLRNSVLIVSVLVNLFILSLWIALQTTTKFDSSLASFFLGR